MDDIALAFVDTDTGRQVYQTCVERRSLLQLDHFARMFTSGMVESSTRKVRVSLPGLTKAGVEQYIAWRSWRDKLTVDDRPFVKYNPYSSIIAEYFGDDLYMSGAYCAPTTLSLTAAEQVVVPAGYYTCGSLLQAICNAVSSRWSVECVIKSLGAEPFVFEFLPDLPNVAPGVAAGANSPLKRVDSGSRAFMIELPRREYDIAVLPTFPHGITPDVAEKVCSQYLIEISTASPAACAYLKLVKFATDNPVIATVMWDDSAETVCELLGVPATNRARTRGFRYLADLKIYARSAARRTRPLPG